MSALAPTIARLTASFESLAQLIRQENFSTCNEPIFLLSESPMKDIGSAQLNASRAVDEAHAALAEDYGDNIPVEGVIALCNQHADAINSLTSNYLGQVELADWVSDIPRHKLRQVNLGVSVEGPISVQYMNANTGLFAGAQVVMGMHRRNVYSAEWLREAVASLATRRVWTKIQLGSFLTSALGVHCVLDEVLENGETSRWVSANCDSAVLSYADQCMEQLADAAMAYPEDDDEDGDAEGDDD